MPRQRAQDDGDSAAWRASHRDKVCEKERSDGQEDAENDGAGPGSSRPASGAARRGQRPPAAVHRAYGGALAKRETQAVSNGGLRRQRMCQPKRRCGALRCAAQRTGRNMFMPAASSRRQRSRSVRAVPTPYRLCRHVTASADARGAPFRRDGAPRPGQGARGSAAAARQQAVSVVQCDSAVWLQRRLHQVRHARLLRLQGRAPGAWLMTRCRAMTWRIAAERALLRAP
jgi:hypothetical protein